MTSFPGDKHSTTLGWLKGKIIAVDPKRYSRNVTLQDEIVSSVANGQHYWATLLRLGNTTAT